MAEFYEEEQKTDIKTDVIRLRDILDGNDPSERKNAAKRVVSLMRQGENVQPLFTSMLRCVKTKDIEKSLHTCISFNIQHKNLSKQLWQSILSFKIVRI